MLTFGSGFGPGSEWFCQVWAHPEPGTGPSVRFSPSPGPRTELQSGSGRFGFGPKFRTELRQPYPATARAPKSVSQVGKVGLSLLRKGCHANSLASEENTKAQAKGTTHAPSF